MICQCKLCQTIRGRFARVDLLSKEHQEYFNTILDYILELESDNDYYKAVLSGQWPSADAVLKPALDKWNVNTRTKNDNIHTNNPLHCNIHIKP